MITRGDWIFIAVANGLSMAIAVPAAIWQWGWIAATVSVVLESALLAVFCLRHREPLFAHLFIFGLVAGWVELANDTWLIDSQKVLVYYGGGPFVLSTPLYMPFSWALIFVTTGVIGLWLWQRLGPWRAAAAMAVIGSLYIPVFEALAAHAHWWYYQNVPMLLNTAPWFVILGEALLVLPLPYMAARMTRSGYGAAATLGIIEGLMIWLTTAIAMALVG